MPNHNKGEILSPLKMDDKKLELLNDHYKDTFSDIEDYQKRREKWFYATVVAIVVLLFQVLAADESATTLSKLLAKYAGMDDKNNTKINIDPKVISSLAWFLLFTFLSRYYQTQTQIENLYDYIKKLETALNQQYKLFGEDLFTRESKSYQTNPITKNVFRYVFPAIFFGIPTISILCSIYKLIFNYSHSSLTHFAIHFIFFLLISYLNYNFLKTSWQEQPKSSQNSR